MYPMNAAIHNPWTAQGFAGGTHQEVNHLLKALQAGYATSSQTGGGALRVQALESTLKVLTWRAHHMKLWQKINKQSAFNTVEEFNKATAWGQIGFGFVRAGELPPNTDSTYVRDNVKIKFLRTLREVEHPMAMVNPAHGDVIAQETMAGTLWLLQLAEYFLFNGNSSLVFGTAEGEQWDGLDKQIDATQFVDIEGEAPQEGDIEEAAQLVASSKGYGYPTDCFIGIEAMSALNRGMFPRERVALPAPVGGRVGYTVQEISTTGGVVQMNPDVFLKPRPSPAASPPSNISDLVPQAPASVTGAVNTGVTNGDFNKGTGTDSSDDGYAYMVTACNRFGESAPTAAMGATVDITQAQKDAGRRIDLTITNHASLAAAKPPEFFRVYRTKRLASGATVPTALTEYSLILELAAASQSNGGTTTANDLNFYLPFTSTAYVGELTPQVLSFKQLAPLSRMDLAVVKPAYQWMIQLYGAPVLYAPAKFCRIINIGALAR